MSQSSQGSEPRTPSKQMSAGAPSFYPGSVADESVLDNALLDAITNIDSTFDFDFNDNASIDSSLGGGGASSNSGTASAAPQSALNTSSFYGQFPNNSTDPVSIPGTQTVDGRHSSFTSQHSHSPTSPVVPAGNSSFIMNQVRAKS